MLAWGGAANAQQEAADSELSTADIEQVLKALEDDEQRAQLVKTLKALSAANTTQTEQQQRDSVKTAATELVELVADKARLASESAGSLVESLTKIPQAFSDWSQKFTQPQYRDRWMTIGWRLLAVLGSGLVAAVLVSLMMRALSKRVSGSEDEEHSYPKRFALLSLLLLFELAPILAFAVVSYAVLTFVDPQQDTRLVAVALINASIFSRLVMVVTRFILSPNSGSLRLWTISDESANYLTQWIKRISWLGIYGFFGLQAAFLLGLDAAMFQTLLRALGLIILLMLLVLIAQNREELAELIAPEQASDNSSEMPSISTLRRALARIWHLIAGVYLVVIYGIWALRIQDGSTYLLRATALSLVILAAGRLITHIIDQIFDRGLSLSDEIQQRYPGLDRRLNRYFPILRKITKVVLVIAIVLFIGHAWGVDTLLWITEGSGKVFLSAALHIFLVLGFAFLVWEIASGSIENYLSETGPDGEQRTRSARTKTLLTVARNALLVVLSVVTLLMVLSELGINIAPLLAGAGVVGLAIGFGAQRLVQDVINGAFILFQDLMSVGDVVKLGDTAGVVEALSIRTVRLRDLAGVVHTIPFSSIEAVSNLTREFSYHVFDMGIAYREDVDEVMDLIRSIGKELQQDETIGPLMLEPVEIFGLDQFGDSAIVIKGRIKTKPIKQWQVGRAFNRLMKIRFDEHNIEIPFPHQTIYFGQDKDGSAPPALLQLEASQLAASQKSPKPEA